MIVNLNYRFYIEFCEMVSNHYFALRVTPRKTPYYNILEFETNDNLYHTIDGFGNTISFGNIKEGHDFFEINTKATLKFVENYFDFDESGLSKFYLFESQFVKYSDKFIEFVKELHYTSDIKKFIANISNIIYETFHYERGVTTTDCTIDTLLKHNKGVCQDFAHLMITTLRYFGIPARYVSGFVKGEGESHAWVEYFDGFFWLGVDPTHNVVITNEPYIKVAHGRDAFDTTMNKGVFVGNGTQRLIITSSVEQ